MFSSLLEDVIKNDENTESHIEKKSGFTCSNHELNIGLDFWYMWSGFTCSNNNILLLVMLGSLWQRNLRI